MLGLQCQELIGSVVRPGHKRPDKQAYNPPHRLEGRVVLVQGVRLAHASMVDRAWVNSRHVPIGTYEERVSAPEVARERLGSF